MNEHESKKIAYGARCTWWDEKKNIGTQPMTSENGYVKHAARLPCCPHCKGMLFEMDNIEVWQEQVDHHDRTNPGYAQMIEWAKGQCFRDMGAMRIAYANHLLNERI